MLGSFKLEDIKVAVALALYLSIQVAEWVLVLVHVLTSFCYSYMLHG